MYDIGPTGFPQSPPANLRPIQVVNGQVGFSVSLDGDRLLIGAPGASTGGRAYIYELDTSGTWGLVATLAHPAGDVAGDEFGYSVALDGDYAVVGVPGRNSDQGVAFVYKQMTPGTWAVDEALTFTAQPGTRVGESVAIDGQDIIVGIPFATIGGTQSGAALGYYRRTDGTYSAAAPLVASATAAGGPENDDEIGAAVAVSDGTVLLGASRDDAGGTNAGAAYVFARTLSSSGAPTYSQIQRLDASVQAAGDRFGFSVSLDDDRAVIGAVFDDDAGFNVGSVHVFDRDPAGVWQETQKLLSPDQLTSSQDNFGHAVAVDGTRVIVGAPESSLVLGTSGTTTTSVARAGGFALYETTLPFVQLEGPEGWHLVAAPGDAETVGSFFEPVWTQCFAGADYDGPACGDPNVYLYVEPVDADKDSGYAPAPSASTAIAPGTGLFAYVFADDDLDGIGDPFPKRLVIDGGEPMRPFSFPVTYTDNLDGGTDLGDDTLDDGWNLLGNPFRSALDWDDLYGTGAGAQADGDVATNVDPTAYVYDPAAGYLVYNAATNTGTLPNAEVPVGAGFFVRANAPNPTLTDGTSGGGGGGANRLSDAAAPHLTLRVASADATGREVSGSAVVALVDGALAGHDPNDAVLLAPPGAPYVSLGVAGEHGPLLHAALPGPSALGAETTLDLALGTAGVSADATVSWDLALPLGWTAALVDRASGAETPMTDGGSLAVDLTGVPGATETGRFAVRLTAGNVTDDEDGPAEAAVSLVRPNPTASAAALTVAVPGSEHVRVALYDALGREVALAHDGAVSGTARVALDVAGLPAGVYVVRVSGETFAEARRLTVVR